MILAVDIGNTNINLGLFDADTLVSQFRIDVIKLQQDCKTIEEYWTGITTGNINNIVTASVNPTAESIFFQWVENKFKKRPIKIGEDIQPEIPIKVRNPKKVGIDRVLNAIAAYRLVKNDVIVVDVGSAITFDVVSNTGEFLGGVIAPGIKMCADALHTQTGQLPLVKVKKVENVLGKDTEEAMIAGIYWGSVGTVNIVLEKLFDQLKSKPDVIATGGDAELIAESINYITKVIPHLTLDGIRIVYEESCSN
ncbi:MAG: type III pantothenate kinase [Candidatus Anammoxibacter sp.]